MVHIYHLHTAMPAEVIAQRKSILLCMDALERVSELWLVGKMVRDLFETVLAFDGFDFRLKQNDNNQKLTGMEFDLEDLNVADGSTPSSQNSDKSLKFLPLTPSLVAHMDAALKSATTPNKSERPSNSNRSSESLLMPPAKQERWQHLKPLTPRTEHHGVHNSSWMDYELPLTPGSTGLNAAEWFV